MKLLVIACFFIFNIYSVYSIDTLPRERAENHQLQNQEIQKHYGENTTELEVVLNYKQVQHENILIKGMDYVVKVSIDLKKEILKLNFIFKPACPIVANCLISPIVSYIEYPIDSIYVDVCQGIEFRAKGLNPLGEEEMISILDNSYNPCGRKALFPPTMVSLKTVRFSNESLEASADPIRSRFSGKVLRPVY